jgi:uncharacterized protein YecE (DUF72 family)
VATTPSLPVADIRVGTSGWSYRAWVGTLYPPKTAASRMLATYAERFMTVEAHNTYRRRPQASTLETWRTQVPPGFRFAPKAHVGISHRRDLDGVERRVADFFGALAPLGDRLGPVLFQLPHRQPELDRLDRLLAALPAEPPAAFDLAPAWHVPEVLERLDASGATLVFSDRDDNDEDDEEGEPSIPAVGRFAYVRLRRTRYDDEALGRWARRLSGLGKPAYVYLRHEGDPLEAVRLSEAVRA